jgi:hypothetical protein
MPYPHGNMRDPSEIPFPFFGNAFLKNRLAIRPKISLPLRQGTRKKRVFAMLGTLHPDGLHLAGDRETPERAATRRPVWRIAARGKCG